MAAATLGSLLKVEVKAPTSPNSGEVVQTISQGRSPPDGKYCDNKPPQQKPSPGFFFHCAQNFGVDDGVVYASYRLKHKKPADNH